MKLIHRNTLSKIGCFLILLLMAARALAVDVTNIYHASVNVSSQSSAERKQALKTAIKQVVLKLEWILAIRFHRILQLPLVAT